MCVYVCVCVCISQNVHKASINYVQRENLCAVEQETNEGRQMESAVRILAGARIHKVDEVRTRLSDDFKLVSGHQLDYGSMAERDGIRAVS